MNTATELTIEALQHEAKAFSGAESLHREASLYGSTDGKAVGTYLEAKFIATLATRYHFQRGNAANGLDFPGLQVDMKVTSVKQPQSSCPFRGLDQKVYGLGYGLIVFVYHKEDHIEDRTTTLRIVDTVYVDASRTADYQMTRGILDTLNSGGNDEDLAAFMQSRALTEDHEYLMALAKRIIAKPPALGYLTISPALQWRLQYKRAIDKAGAVDGVTSVYHVDL